MSKYDSQLGSLKDTINQASNVLVLIPAGANTDKLAAGLSLALSLQHIGKKVTAVTQDELKVFQAGLFGVGDVKQNLPQSGGGNLTLTLEGVVDNDGKVPALETLDWFPEGNNLNLVFKVVPGQNFEPKNIVTKKDDGGVKIDLIFVAGATNPQDLGSVLSQNPQILSSAHTVNIDNNRNNSNFGATNIVDEHASSVSEMVSSVLSGLSLPVEQDISSNILTGIYSATSNLTQNVGAETFLAVGQALQHGGKLPVSNSETPAQPANQTAPAPEPAAQAAPAASFFDQAPIQQAPAPAVQTQPEEKNPEVLTEQKQSEQPAPAPEGFDLSKIFQINQNQPAGGGHQHQHHNQPQQKNEQPRQSSQNEGRHSQQNQPREDRQKSQQPQQQQSSPEEKPAGEAAVTQSPEGEGSVSPAPDWLTPKIFRSGQG